MILAALTAAILLFGLVGILNSSGAIRFLPSSVDPKAGTQALWGYAGLAALFWSVRDWVGENPKVARRLLWFILLNAGVIGVTALANRLSASHRVLWLYRPEVVSTYYVFGPFEYRATASQFYNLLWPAALGIHLLDRTRNPPPRVLFPASLAILLITCPLITSSRGGMLMAGMGAAVMIAALLLSGQGPRLGGRRAWAIAGSVILLAGVLGGKPLEKRWRETRSVERFLNLGGRLEQNENSWRIIADHPLWGVGAGAYETAFRSYGFKNAFKPDRTDPKEQKTWDFFYAKAHNDWLQTLAEWGAPATVALLCALLFALVGPIISRPPNPLTIGIGTGILITILHGAFDYPLQNYAILAHCAALLALNFVSPTELPTPPSEGESKGLISPDPGSSCPAATSTAPPLPPAASPPASAPGASAGPPPP